MKSLAILLVLLLTFILTSCGPPSSPGIEVNRLEDQVVLPDGNASGLNVSKVGTTKRLRVEVIPNGNSIPDTEVVLQFSLNQNSSLAMNDATSLVATRQNGTPTTNSTFAVDVPGSRELTRCQWFHYRWFIRYNRSGDTSLRSSYVGEVRPFQVTFTQPVGADFVEPPCPGVP